MAHQLQLATELGSSALGQHEQLQATGVEFGHGRQIHHQAHVLFERFNQRALEFVSSVNAEFAFDQEFDLLS